MKVLVTGAKGMIGSAVLASDASTGAEVRSHTGREQCDITDGDAMRPIVDGVDAVIHLAGPPSVADSFRDPAGYLRVHVLGTATVVELCQELGIPRIVYVSSADVYGRPTRNPVDESAAFAPRSPYAAAKVAAENVIGAATRSSGLDAVILRPFSIYGPGCRPASVVGLILNQVIAGRRVRLTKLDPVRDYCYVDDVASAVWRAASLPPADSTEPRVYNVSTGRGTRVDQLAQVALSVSGPPTDEDQVELISGSDPDRPLAADILELIADVSRSRDELGWVAKTSLPDGLARTLEWFATINHEVEDQAGAVS